MRLDLQRALGADREPQRLLAPPDGDVRRVGEPGTDVGDVRPRQDVRILDLLGGLGLDPDRREQREGEEKRVSSHGDLFGV